MTEKILEFRNKPVMCLCSSEKGIEPLVEASKRASSNTNLVLLLDYSERTISRALPAFINASIRFSEKIARSNSMQVEMLLLVSGTMNISKALRECGAKDPKKFLLFATNKSLLSKFIKTNKIKVTNQVELKLDQKISGKVAITGLMNE